MFGTAVASVRSMGLSEQELYEIVRDGYVYAYPLVLHHVAILQLTNFAAPTGVPGQGPPNVFSHSPAFPPMDYTALVRANVDTLYSVAHLDLGPEPMVLSMPAVDRWFVMQLLSLWTDVFAAPGTRTTGRAARSFLLVGPAWRGEVPSGLELIRSPTRLMSVGGRIQTNGVADYESVHRIQSRFCLTPLSTWVRREYTAARGVVDPAIDMRTPPPAQVAAMNAAVFFGRFAELLKDNPPGSHDYPMIHRLQQAGLEVGERFDLDSMAASLQPTWERATTDGRALVASLGRKAIGEGGREWVYSATGGSWGVNYRDRAAIAHAALGQNLPQDAVYPALSCDSEGRMLDGRHRYVLRFGRGRLPPVDAFWSVTAYDTEGYFIPNPLKRQALGDRDPLVMNPDGSLDLWIGAEPPGPGKEANWLPTAKAPFTLLMRLYSPKSEVLDCTWTPPLVRRLS